MVWGRKGMLRAPASWLQIALFAIISSAILTLALASAPATGSACLGGIPDWTGTSGNDTKTAAGDTQDY
jgi:hypothetical protein